MHATPHRLYLRLLPFILLISSVPGFAQRVIANLPDAFTTGPQIATNPATNKIYITGQGDNELTIIDGATNEITDVPLSHGPTALALNTVTHKIYVTEPVANVVSVIDEATLSVTTVTVGEAPVSLAVNSITNKVYVANANSNSITVIDGATLATTTLQAGEGPLAVAVNPVTNKIYVGNQAFFGPATLTVINGATNQTSTIELPSQGNFFRHGDTLAVDSVRNQIYADGSFYLFIIDGVTNNVSEIQWPNVACAATIAINANTNLLYASDPCSGGYDVVDPTTTLIDAIYAASAPTSFTMDLVRNRLYGVDPYEGIFSAVDLAYRTLTTFRINSHAVAVNPVTNLIYVDNYPYVSVIAGAAPLQFVAMHPCRLFDTRNTTGPIQGGSSQNFPILQEGGCSIPSTAAAYSVNLTMVPFEGNPVGYLTLWPTDQPQPTASTMNSLDGRTKANAAIVPAGSLGALSIYASNTTDVVMDIDGYFAPADETTLAFHSLRPCRVIDTRDATSDLGGPYLTGGATRSFPVLESSCIPQGSDPQAYSFNFTAVPHPAGNPLGFLTVWPEGESRPGVSTLNNPTGTVVANAAIVPAGTDGGISVFPSNDTDLVVDINGYFTSPGPGGLSLYPMRTCRVIDTRNNDGEPFSGVLVVHVRDGCLIPPTTQAYVFNATVVPSGPLGYLTLWPDGEVEPGVSTLNALDGLVTSNMAIVPTTNGSIDAFASNLTQLVLDISSYFAP